MTLFLLLLGTYFLAQYNTTPTTGWDTLQRVEGRIILSRTLEVDGKDHKAIGFTVPELGGVLVWDWATDGREEVNWYLMTLADYQQWEQEQNHDYIIRAKNVDGDHGLRQLEAGHYVLLWNNINEDDVDVEADVVLIATIEENIIVERYDTRMRDNALITFSVAFLTFLLSRVEWNGWRIGVRKQEEEQIGGGKT